MPLVLATGSETESGHTYADVLGRVYEYPLRYRNLIRAGEDFIYYRGRRRAGGGTQPQVYLGSGIIGETSAGSQPDLMQCHVLRYNEFPDPVPFRTAEGGYLEPGGARRGYFQPGVRRIDVETWKGIVNRSAARASRLPETDAAAAYVPAALARRIEDISRRVALDVLRRRDDVLDAVPMSYDNPGYDILVTTKAGPLFVEVKGTQGRIPGFFLSEGERRFAVAHAPHYLMIVVTGIDSESGVFAETHFLEEAPDATNTALQPSQWRGQLSARGTTQPHRAAEPTSQT